jgi:hypothetical protein
MLTYNEVSQDSRKFLALTGYTVKEFQALLPYFHAQFAQFVATTRLDGKPRTQRQYTDYQNSPLPTIADKQFFILAYLKQGTIQTTHGALFGMHQSDANRWIHLLHPLLNQALAALDELPARDAQEWNVKVPQPGTYFHDGVERAMVRPSDPEEQQTYYSGKKKQHTLKNILVIDAACKVRFLSATCEGKKHDKKAADEAGYQLPAGSTLYQDTGFQGFALPGVTVHQPMKKPRGRELTPEEKATNRRISQIRIRVEHAISGVKRFRIVKDEIRNWKEGFRDEVMETCCGLHNFRLNHRPWHYAALVT